MPQTESASATGRPEGRPVAPTVVVAWHPDPRFLGAARRLTEGAVVELGRGSAALGPDALDDPRVSTRHAALAVRGGGVRVTDLGSRNGTWLDGVRLEGEVGWAPGQVLVVGRVALVLEQAPVERRPSLLRGLVGASAAMAPVLETVELAAPLEATVLVRGETGTGKELVARALHERSGRSGPFLAVSCAAVDVNLLQSELFGHERGAFSGADRARRGLVEEASGGTLLLDEIGEAPPALQAALLRVLQEREVRPVGGNRSVPVRTRFVAATHRDLEAMVDAGTFRLDLLARLRVWEVVVPPLRDRRADLVPIALAAAERAAGRPVALHARLALHLLHLPLRGNVRELVGLVEEAVARAGAEDPIPLPASFGADPAPPTPAPSAEPAKPKGPRERPDADGLRAGIAAHGGNLRAYARELGVGRSTLYRWLDAAGLPAADLRDGS